MGDVAHGGGTFEGTHGAVAILNPAADGTFGDIVGAIQALYGRCAGRVGRLGRLGMTAVPLDVVGEALPLV